MLVLEVFISGGCMSWWRVGWSSCGSCCRPAGSCRAVILILPPRPATQLCCRLCCSAAVLQCNLPPVAGGAARLSWCRATRPDGSGAEQSSGNDFPAGGTVGERRAGSELHTAPRAAAGPP